MSAPRIVSGSGRRPHVVVVGGGFGGVAAVRALKHADVDVTLVDRNLFNTFQPLLYQVATASLNPGDVTWFLRSIRSGQKNVQFVHGDMAGLELPERRVRLSNGTELTYDYLVLATGVTANFFGIPGAAEHAFPLYTRSDALAFRDHLSTALEHAVANQIDRDLRVVVVGGGATGVEMAGALAEMRNKDQEVLFPELDASRTHITLVEMADDVLGPFDADLRAYARRSLARRGVDLRLATSVKEVRERGVVVEHDDEETFLDAGLVVWASGVTAPEIVGDWGLPQGQGDRIRIDDHLRVQGHPQVYAVGDIAVEDDDRALPQLAQPAIQGGTYAGQDIAARVAGGTGKDAPFAYKDLGTMATIGRSSAVAQVKGLPKLKGFPAWVIWTVVHVQSLLGNRNRVATMVNLTARYLFWSRNHNAIVGESRPVELHDRHHDA